MAVRALRVVVVVVTVVAGAGSAAAGTPSLDFDRTFGVEDDDAGLWHVTATYVVAGRAHRLELWRDGETRLRRRTDDAIDLFVVRAAGGPEWSMTVLDLKRRIRTDVDRTSLYRIGHPVDWFALAHVVARPRGDYRLTTIDADPPRVDVVAPCRWYRLVDASHTSQLCWSDDARVPLAIVTDGVVAWRATALEPGPFGDDPFAIDDRGFVRNDANEDIRAD